jgi:hypothetical protein
MLELDRRCFLAAGGLAPLTAAARADRLSGAYPLEKLGAMLVARSQWRPYPPGSDRPGWAKLPEDVRQALIREGLEQRDTEWPPLPATWFLDYVRTGDRARADSARARRRNKLRALVVAECAEGQGRFLDAIADGLWLTCEESYWGSPAHLNMQRAGAGLPDVAEPTVDLFAAETAALLAWTDYLLGPALDQLSPLIRKRLYLEVDRRVLTPCEQRDDFWWMGLGPGGPSRVLNNWTPWINSNWLAANLLLEPDEKRRLRMVHKSLQSLDRFLAGYHDDGGCDEGPGYWGRAAASLFDCLELLHSASRGAIDIYGDPLVGEMGRYIVRAHIYDDWFINFADASARIRIDGDLVYRYGRRIGDRDMQLLGAFAARAGEGYTGRGDIGRQLPALFNVEALRAAPKGQPLLRDVWLPGIQVMAARLRQGSPEGLYLAAKGGHNAESHNHNDVGNFIVYAGGRPAIIDIGVETYTAKTFSKQRYEIWTMQSAWHNLPTIDGVMQAPGRRYAAREVSCRTGDRQAEFSLDIADAYPAEAGIVSWRRTLTLDRAANQVRLREQFRLSRTPRTLTLSLVTPGPVQVERAGRVRLGPVAVEFDPAALAPKTEEVPLEDARLRQVWGGRLFRVLLADPAPARQGEWAVRISPV